jgi:hypothetical protein
MDVDVEIAKLKILKSAHYSQQYRLEGRVRNQLPQEIHALTERIAGYEADIARLHKNTPAGHAEIRDFFALEAMNRTYDKREEAGKALLSSFRLVSPESKNPIQVGHYRGFELWASFDAFSHDFEISLKGTMVHKAVMGSDALGNVQRLDNSLERIPGILQQCQDELAALEHQVINAKAEIGKPFPQEQELNAKMARLVELDGLLKMDEKVQPVIDGEEPEPEQERTQTGSNRDEVIR